MASVGCSLMEAYNVPSFDPPRRRKGCVVDPSEIKTSSEPFDPYADARGQGGVRSEMAAVPRSRASAKSSGNEMESFENAGPTMPKYYSGYTQDKKYYCDTYNICPKTTEGFENQPLKKTNGTGTSTTSPQSCQGPLIAPNYEYPMTPEARRQYDKAIDLAVNQPQGATPYEIPPPLARAQDGDVSGYSDEDLDKFLKTNEMKSFPFELPKVPKDDRPVSGRDAYATPFAETMKNFTAADGTPQLRPVSADADTEANANKERSSGATKKDPWDKVWDMALFVVAGLLVILLLDQLFKLAMLYGMKRAFLAIEPLLEKAMAS